MWWSPGWRSRFSGWPSVCGPRPCGSGLLTLGFLLLGNLTQGGFRIAFAAPLRILPPGRHYVAAASSITNGAEWLRSFTSIQSGLYRSPSTHPPFAVLLHRVLSDPTIIAVVFTLVASLSVLLVRRTLIVLGVHERRATLAALFFALIPAFNIYGGVSLDGVILTTSTLCLLGLARLTHEAKWSWGAFSWLAAGFLLTNALTLGGLFLAGVMLVFAFGNRTAARALLLVADRGAACLAAMKFGLGYDHVAAFRNASIAENPLGFELVGNTRHYLFTRFENVGNILLFFSIPALAVFFHRRSERIGVAGMAVLGAMFLAGSCRTGEAARATMFIFPFLVLSFRDSGESVLRYLVAGAGIQTILMQLVGGYGC
ncbi:MAG: hypothetical protein ABIE42_11880 [Candidatus Eisenbacteria bacterium]